jgi:hypothetical protein
MMKLGSRAWGQKTGGALDFLDRLAFAAQSVQAVLLARTAKWRDRAPRKVARPKVPASPAHEAAIAFCASVSEPWLVNHCHRTFIWGTVLSQYEGLDFDEELFAVSCMLHDLGLAKPVRERRTEACFAVAGAEEAAAFASRELRWSDVRCHQLAEAISLHLNLVVTKADGVEAYLLQAGAGLDVLGVRRSQVPEGLREQVLETYPRHEQNRKLAEVCAHEADAHPRSRIGFTFRHLGAQRRIERCPLETV